MCRSTMWDAGRGCDVVGTGRVILPLWYGVETEIFSQAAYEAGILLSREEAEPLLALGGEGTPIRDELLLVEQGYGVAEGSSQDAAYDDPQDPMYNYGHAPQDYRPPEGGESFEALCLRARVFLSRCLLPLEGQYDTVLVSAHGALLCAIFRELLGTPMEDFWQNLLPHGGVRVMTVENGCCRLLEAPPSVRP